MSEKQRVLLIQPPYGDLTYPYHSLSYVSAALRAAGYDVDVLDLNALWFRSLFNQPVVRGWQGELEGELAALDAQPALTLAEQARVVELLQDIGTCRWLDPAAAVAVLQGPDFYDFDRYRRAREQVRAFEKLLSRLYAPFDFFTAYAIPPYEARAAALVDKALACHRFIEDAVRILGEHTGAHRYLFCGVSVPFSANLALGLATLEAAHAVHPEALRVAGGTAISDIYKYRAAPDSLQPLSRICDYLYIGEAETAIEEFAAYCSGAHPSLPTQAVDLGRAADSITLRYISLSERGEKQRRFQPYSWRENPPDYGWIDWSLYLAPERRINYSPSRGCFWNQCTFCDYGLNEDGPTAPSRTMDVDTCVEHLKQLAAVGVRHVYLAVDAIAPAFLSAFADRLIAEKLDIHWSSQFFLTKSFNADLVHRLVAAGLRTASFGLESGSSPVLERMGKGKHHVESVFRPVFDLFRDSPVGLQPLFFFGFPGEGDGDRQATVDLLLEYRDVFSTVTKGGLFALLSGSMVARDPARFGVRNIRRLAGDELVGGLAYEHDDGSPAPTCDSFSRFNRQLPDLELFERPWAGGIDSFFTQLYIERHGRDVFHRIRERERDREPGPWTLVAVTSHFDLDEVMENAVIEAALATDAGRLQLMRVLPNFDEDELRADLRVTRQEEALLHEIRFRLYREPASGDAEGACEVAASPASPSAAQREAHG